MTALRNGPGFAPGLSSTRRTEDVPAGISVPASDAFAPQQAFTRETLSGASPAFPMRTSRTSAAFAATSPKSTDGESSASRGDARAGIAKKAIKKHFQQHSLIGNPVPTPN